MLSVLNVRANQHNSCEDSVFVKETDDHIWGVLCDGCSTGTKSHFASQTFAYFIENEGSEILTSDHFMFEVKSFILKVMLLFNFTHMNMLSTLLLFSYNKKTRVLKLRAFGDGYFYIPFHTQEETKLVIEDTDGDKLYETYFDQGNTPDYIAYHILKTNPEFFTYLNAYPEREYQNVDRFMITTDGIKSLNRSQFAPDSKVNSSILYTPPVSANYLTRMWNCLKREGYQLSDDLTIVSYAENS